jgi:hypothetical protein
MPIFPSNVLSIVFHYGYIGFAPMSKTEIAHPDTQKQLVNDEAIDVFATLFSPATPRPTPTSSPRHVLLPLNPVPHTRSLERSSSLESEFGAFVSVAQSEDPLSAAFTPLASPTRGEVELKEKPGQNASLLFFDNFTSEAKRASEANKKGYLEELLIHEDDPSTG